jgi:hypothetical protein
LPVSKAEINDLIWLNYKMPDPKQTAEPKKGDAKTPLDTFKPVNPAAPTDDELVGHATAELRDFLLRTRLLPRSDAFCAEAAQHPLCIGSRRLREIVASVPFTIAASDVKATPPPPPPPIVPPAPKPLPPERDPCRYPVYRPSCF